MAAFHQMSLMSPYDFNFDEYSLEINVITTFSIYLVWNNFIKNMLTEMQSIKFNFNFFKRIQHRLPILSFHPRLIFLDLFWDFHPVSYLVQD